MTHPDIEAIRQSPRQWCDIQTIERLSDYAMILELENAALKEQLKEIEVTLGHFNSLHVPEQINMYKETITALKEQVAQLKFFRSELAAVALAIPDCRYMDPPDGGSVSLSEQVGRMWQDVQKWQLATSKNSECIRDQHETIAQQAEVIEQIRDVFKAASMDTETINRKAPEIAKDCCSMPMPDTYGMYHLTDEEVCNVVRYYLYWLHKNQPINLQPSPELLQTRD